MTSDSTTPRSPNGYSGPDSTTTKDVRWWLMVAFAVSAVLGIHLLVLVGNRGPVLYSDALGYLGNARFLAGGAAPLFDGSSYYAAGYSLLLVPLYWITSRSSDVWLLAVLLNVVLAVLIMLPAYLISKRLFELPRTDALIGAIAVSLTPALILQPGRVWVETVFPLVFISSVVAVHKMITSRRTIHGIAAGALVGYLVFIHGRGIAIALAFLTLLIIAYAMHHLSAKSAGSAVLGTGIGFLVDGAARNAITAQLWTTSLPSNAGSVDDILAALSPDGIAQTATFLLGHMWYVVAVSFGIAIVGVINLGGIVRRARESLAASARALVAMYVVLSTVAVTVLSAAVLSTGTRVDHLVYGRYIEGVTPILILAGVAYMLRYQHRAKTIAFSAIALLGTGMLLYWLVGSSGFSGNVQMFTIPGLLGLQTLVAGTDGIWISYLNVVKISLLSAAIAIAIALVALGRQRMAVALFVSLTVGITFVGKTTSWDPFAQFWFDEYNQIPSALEEDPLRTVNYDLRYLDPSARNLYEFRIAPRSLVVVENSCQAPSGELLISAAAPGELLESGSELIATDLIPNQALWVIAPTMLERCDN